MVTSEEVTAEELNAKVQEAKDMGRRILALSPSLLKKMGIRTTEFHVVRYILVTQ